MSITELRGHSVEPFLDFLLALLGKFGGREERLVHCVEPTLAQCFINAQGHVVGDVFGNRRHPEVNKEEARCSDENQTQNRKRPAALECRKKMLLRMCVELRKPLVD